MVMRLSGFSNTGIDIDDTVSKLMKAARMPMQKLKQQKQTLEWQRDDYRSMNSKIMAFRDLAFNMKLQSSYQSKKAVSAQEDVVSVSATSVATQGNYSLEIKKLATSASVTSGNLGATSNGGSTKLSALGNFTDTTLTIAGEKGAATIRVKPTDTIDGLVAEINGKSSITGINVSYDKTIDKFFFVSSTTGGKSEVKLSTNDSQDLLTNVLKLPSSTLKNDDGLTITGTESFASGVGTLIDSSLTSAQKLKIKVGATTAEFDINSTTTIGKLVDAINSSDIGKKERVSAYIDKDNKLAFFNPDGPADLNDNTDPRKVTFTDETSDSVDLLAKLGLTAPDIPASKTNYYEYSIKGEQAEVSFNGAQAFYDTNTFSINGMTFTAKKEGEPAVNITITQDVDTVYNSIKTFVDKYNELIDTVNKKVNEKRYRDFQPLTDEERDELKEDQIKKWEEKAMSGMLRSDPLLTRGLSSLRSSFSNIVEGLPTGNAKSLSEIGISTTLVVGSTVSGSYSENGKIYIDEAKLKKAIAEKPDEVMALFNATDGLKDSDKGDGLATRLYDKANALMTQITTKAGVTASVEDSFQLGKTTKDLNKRIDLLTRKMEDLETRYYKQFTAMEKFISQLSMQSAQLAQSFGQ